MGATTPARQVQFLRRYTAAAEKQLMQDARMFEKRLAVTISDMSDESKTLHTSRGQQAVYKRVQTEWGDFGDSYDEWAKVASKDLSKTFKGYAVDSIAASGGKVAAGVGKWSPDYAKKVYELIAPANNQNLAGVFTDKMTRTNIQSLRSAVIDVNRQAALEGWTARKIRKEIEGRWWALSRSASDSMFTDISGRSWSNKRYLQMLTKTTTARIARESYNQTLIDNGDDLERIRNVGDSCPTCKAWDMVIISISGDDPNYPSYREAVDAGVFHPNCDCLTQRIDETVDADDIEHQARQKNVDWEDLESVKAYGEKARDE